jgi:hypothetical protein
LKEIRDGKLRESPVRPVLFDELAGLYEKQAKGKRSYHNEKYYIKTLRGHFAGRVIPELTALDVEGFQTERKDSPTRAKKPRSGETAGRVLQSLATDRSVRFRDWDAEGGDPRTSLA